MRLLAASIVAMMVLAGAAPAQAAIVVGTFQGTILYGIDGSGFFTGLAGSDLSGPVSGRFRYDTSLAQPGGAPGEYINGSSAWLGFSVSIAGVTYDFGGLPAGDVVQTASVVDDGPGGDSLVLLSQAGGASGEETVILDLSGADADFLTGIALPEAFTYASSAGGVSQLLLDNGTANATVLFTVEDATARLAPTGGIPEPATWGLLIGGSMAIGSVLRSRRRRVLAA